MLQMGCCLPGILLGQLMQRLKLNFMGMESGDTSNTCTIAMIITLVALAASMLIGGVADAGASTRE